MKCLLQLPSICSWVHNLDYFISASNKLNEISIWAESNLPGSGPICHHISLGVCCITAVFLCNQMRPQHLPWGEEGEKEKAAEEGKALGSVVHWRKKYIHNSLYPSTGATKYFNEYRTLAFMESVDSSWESFICFRASIFNIHKYLLNRPEWFHIERWYQNKQAESERHFQHWKTK